MKCPNHSSVQAAHPVELNSPQEMVLYRSKPFYPENIGRTTRSSTLVFGRKCDTVPTYILFELRTAASNQNMIIPSRQEH
jgi:hypothetical protein